jgi:hypothetical protein
MTEPHRKLGWPTDKEIAQMESVRKLIRFVPKLISLRSRASSSRNEPLWNGRYWRKAAVRKMSGYGM